MTARNDITGDVIATGTTSDSYRTGWDRIFGKKPKEVPKEEYTCDECDPLFPCYSSQNKCIRLPHEPIA